MVLILAAIVLFVLEAKVTSYGLLASLGIAVMILGSLILINSPLPELRVQMITAVGITLPFAAITIFLMRLVILAHRNKSVTGKEGMVGEIGTALTDIESQGKVQVHGEIWQASSPQPIESGNRVPSGGGGGTQHPGDPGRRFRGFLELKRRDSCSNSI